MENIAEIAKMIIRPETVELVAIWAKCVFFICLGLLLLCLVFSFIKAFKKRKWRAPLQRVLRAAACYTVLSAMVWFGSHQIQVWMHSLG